MPGSGRAGPRPGSALGQPRPVEGRADRLAPARGEVARDHGRVGPAARRAETGTAAARAEKTAAPAAAAALLLATTPAGADAPRTVARSRRPPAPRPRRAGHA